VNEYNELIAEVKLLKKEMELLKEAISGRELNKKKEQVLGDFISEQQVKEITGLSRGTLLKLRNEGHISRSSIGGKSNFYRAGDFRRLLERREKEN